MPLRQIVERLAANELHHHQELVLLLMVQFVDRGDAGVIETREGNRLGPEALEHVGVGQIGIEDLDCDLTIERLIDCLIDSTHATATKLVDDAVLPDGGADHCWRS